MSARVFFAFIVIPVLCLGQDSDYLATISRCLDDIRTDTWAIQHDVSSLRDIETNSLRQLRILNASSDKMCLLLSNINDVVQSFEFGDRGFTNDIRQIVSLEQAQTNLLQKVYEQLQLFRTMVSSNQLALIATTYYGSSWLSSGNVAELRNQWDLMIRNLQSGLYYPVWSQYGTWREIPYYYFSLLDYDQLPSEFRNKVLQSWSRIFGSPYGSRRSFLSDMSQPYYYLYGTRHVSSNIVQSVEQNKAFFAVISNALVVAANSDIDQELRNNTLIDSEGSFSSCSTGFVARVGRSLAVAAGISSVEGPQTNDVSGTTYPELGSNEQIVKRDSLESDVTDGVNILNSSVDSLVDSFTMYSDTSGDFEIDFGSFFGESDPDYVLRVTPISSQSRLVLQFLIKCVRVIATLMLATGVYRKVCGSGTWTNVE